MKRLLAVVSMLVGSAFSGYADDVRLPSGPPIVVPPAPPAPNIQNLASDQFYIIDSDVKLNILSSPEGVVSVSEDTGPVKIRGKFVDGTGKNETRNFAGKFIYTVDAVGSGPVELILIDPTGKVIRRKLNVGTAPPTPPNPDPKPTSFGAKLKAAYNSAPDPGSLTKLVTILDEVTAQDYQNFDQMATVLQKTGKKYLPNDELRKVRDTISDELTSRFGTDPRRFDVDKVKGLYKEAITALK